MAKSFTYGGVDMADYNVQVVEFDVPEMATIPLKTHAAIYGDSAFTSTNHTIREIKLKLSVGGTSETDMYSNIDALKGALNPILADKVLSIDAIPNRRFLGRTKAISQPSVKGRWVRVFDVSIVTLAHTQASAEVTSSGALATSPDTVTISAVAGNVSRTPAEFYLRNTTGAAITSGTITLENETTNETIIWKGTIPNGYWLRFGTLNDNGTHKSTIQMSTTGGADPSILLYANAEVGYQSGDWTRLKGGVDNDITVTGITTGTLLWVYRGRYL